MENRLYVSKWEERHRSAMSADIVKFLSSSEGNKILQSLVNTVIVVSVQNVQSSNLRERKGSHKWGQDFGTSDPFSLQRGCL